MAVQTLAENVFYVGSRDWDRKLFDELINEIREEEIP